MSTMKDPYVMPPEGETLRQFYKRCGYLGSFDDLSEASLQSLEQERQAEIAIFKMAQTGQVVFWQNGQGYIRYPDGTVMRHERG